MESDTILQFKAWLTKNGGRFNPYVQFSEVPSGFSVFAREVIPPDTSIVTCPFTLAITPEISSSFLSSLPSQADPKVLAGWSERQLISSYVCLHWILPSPSQGLVHLPYILTLPAAEKLRTPLHFTSLELEAFKGTNLYGAAIDRENEWRNEWAQCQKFVATVNARWGEEFTWERYLTASTYLSSRAFPSTLLSPSPSLQSSPAAYPVLLPGIDSLNHARGQPVSWVVSYPKSDTPSPSHEGLYEPNISLVLHSSAATGEELFNNYGAKPNSELILGYGFSISDNPDDTIVLKIGGIQGKKWEVGRGAVGADGLWEEILDSVFQDPQERTFEDGLEAAQVLADMSQALLDRLPHDMGLADRVNMRPEVALMLHDYVEGQRDILQSLTQYALNKEHLAVEEARSQGIELVFEDD